MTKIPLTRGLYAKVNKRDFPFLIKKKWYSLWGGSRYYAARDVRIAGKKKTILMHRQILKILNPKIQVDHKNLDSLDNTRKNLRIASPSQNLMNTARRRDNTSGFKGVSWNSVSGKWRADIQVFGRQFFLGHFSSRMEAANRYDIIAKYAFRKFVRGNFTSNRA